MNREKQEKAFQELLSQGINTKDKHGKTPLMWICELYPERLEEFLKNGADPKAMDQAQRTPLDYLLSFSNHGKDIKPYIDLLCSYDISKKCLKDSSLMLRSMYFSDKSLPEFLCQRGFEINFSLDYYKRTLLMHAVEHKHPFTHYLLKNYSKEQLNINAISELSSEQQKSILDVAAEHWPDLILPLIKKGANPLTKQKGNRNFLFNCFLNSYPERKNKSVLEVNLDKMFNYLFEKNVLSEPVLNKIDSYGNNILKECISGGYFKVMPLLLKFGVNPNIDNMHSETPLHTLHYTKITLDQFRKNIQALLSSGADIDYVNKNNNTPLMEYISSGNIKQIEVFLEFKPNINAKNNRKTVLQYALDNLNIAEKVINLLIECPNFVVTKTDRKCLEKTTEYHLDIRKRLEHKLKPFYEEKVQSDKLKNFTKSAFKKGTKLKIL